jgi:hypothetical protein
MSAVVYDDAVLVAANRNERPRVLRQVKPSQPPGKVALRADYGKYGDHLQFIHRTAALAEPKAYTFANLVKPSTSYFLNFAPESS